MRRACLGLAVGLALGAAHAGARTLEITSIPAYASLGLLTGQVDGVDPATHHVATFIQIEGAGWWTKPTLASPTVPIATDGSFSVDVGTGGPASLDSRATIFCAALLPIAESAPTVSGASRIPGSLAPLALDCQESYARTPSFAGYSWAVKEAPIPVGPGGNRFSDRAADVFVDGDGLHLRVDLHDGEWWSAEVMLLESLGYGSWLVQTDSRIDLLDPNGTFAIFTWDPPTVSRSRWWSATSSTCPSPRRVWGSRSVRSRWRASRAAVSHPPAATDRRSAPRTRTRAAACGCGAPGRARACPPAGVPASRGSRSPAR